MAGRGPDERRGNLPGSRAVSCPRPGPEARSRGRRSRRGGAPEGAVKKLERRPALRLPSFEGTEKRKKAAGRLQNSGVRSVDFAGLFDNRTNDVSVDAAGQSLSRPHAEERPTAASRSRGRHLGRPRPSRRTLRALLRMRADDGRSQIARATASWWRRKSAPARYSAAMACWPSGRPRLSHTSTRATASASISASSWNGFGVMRSRSVPFGTVG